MEKIKAICEQLNECTSGYDVIMRAAQLIQESNLDQYERDLMAWNVFSILSDNWAPSLWDLSNIAISEIHKREKNSSATSQ